MGTVVWDRFLDWHVFLVVDLPEAAPRAHPELRNQECTRMLVAGTERPLKGKCAIPQRESNRILQEFDIFWIVQPIPSRKYYNTIRINRTRMENGLGVIPKTFARLFLYGNIDFR